MGERYSERQMEGGIERERETDRERDRERERDQRERERERERESDCDEAVTKRQEITAMTLKNGSCLVSRV